MEVCLAYVFARLEQGQNMALYGGVVRVHKVNGTIAGNAVEREYLTSDRFVRFYNTIFGTPPPHEVRDDLKKAFEEAQTTRNRIMHGKRQAIADKEIRKAIACVLCCAEEINNQLESEFVTVQSSGEQDLRESRGRCYEGTTEGVGGNSEGAGCWRTAAWQALRR